MSARTKIFKTLAVIVGIASVLGGLDARSEHQRIKAYGAVAVLESVENVEQTQVRRHRSETAEFKFRTAAGEEIQARRELPGYVADNFDAGRPVRVFYNPHHPSEFVFARERTSWLLIAGGIGFAVAALIFI